MAPEEDVKEVRGVAGSEMVVVLCKENGEIEVNCQVMYIYMYSIMTDCGLFPLLGIKVGKFQDIYGLASSLT